MLNHFFHTFFRTIFHLAPWLIPTALFVLIGAYLIEHTRIGDILIDLLRRISGRE